MHPLRAFFRDFEWIHTTVGVTGNTLFVIGSVLFLWESTKLLGVWVFIIGSSFMLFGAVGSAVVKLEDRSDRQRRDQNEHAPAR